MNKNTRTKIEKFTRAKLCELFGGPDNDGYDDIWSVPFRTHLVHWYRHMSVQHMVGLRGP